MFDDKTNVITERERDILTLIENDPLTTQQAIAERLGITRSAVAGHIMKLTSKGVIRGRAYVLSERRFIVAIGGATMDVHGRPSAVLERGDSNPGRVYSSPGGVARNIAENLARLGVDCRLMTVVGRDAAGDALLQRGREAGIDMRLVQRSVDCPTATYLSVLDRQGQLDVAISDLSALESLDRDILEPHARMLNSASAVVLDTNLPPAALDYLCSMLTTTPIFVDTVSAAKAPRIRPHLAAVHTITPSVAEARTISGLAGRGARGLRSLANWFHDQGVARIFITLGKDGVYYSDGDAYGTKPAFDPAESGNTNGVGDAFAAGIAAATLFGWDLEKTLRLALAAARHTLSDTNTVSRSLDLEHLLELGQRHAA